MNPANDLNEENGDNLPITKRPCYVRLLLALALGTFQFMYKHYWAYSNSFGIFKKTKLNNSESSEL